MQAASSDFDVSTRPSTELPSLYESCALTAYLTKRRIDSSQALARGLVFHLPSNALVPSWAACGQPWPKSGHRIICPVFDARGELRSVRAWSPTATERKRVAPKGFSTSGLVLADLLGQAMLRGDAKSSRVLIFEGEADLVCAASMGRLLDAERPAMIGVVSGAWTAEIAARIPDGAEVRIATDADSAGDLYASKIAISLRARCTVLRVRTQRDFNDEVRHALAS
jgi:Toprim-like